MRDTDAMIAALAAHPERTAVLVDFDGSLAPIVERAEDARPLPAALDVLAELAPRLGKLGVISGRPVAFLAEQLPVSDLELVGLYGLQTLRDGVVRNDPSVEPYLESIAAATGQFEARLPSALVEPKAGVCVTLHWRPAPERADEVKRLADEVAQRFGLAQLHSGYAVELRPPVDIDKGTAVRTLVRGFEVGAFAGDDRGDLPAFAALASSDLRAAFRVGVLSPEAPPELRDAVDIVVDGPTGLVDLLRRLSEQIVEPV